MAVKTVQDYISRHSHWAKGLEKLDGVLSETDLIPEIKWGAPVYTLNGKNVVGIGAFKNHFALWFFNGALLRKNTSLILNAQEGKTKGLRQIRFEKNEDVDVEALIPYIKEAIQNQKEGKEFNKTSTKKLIIPEELKDEFKKDSELEESFKKISPGKQREYADYISEAKRESTKESRIRKIIPMIKLGKGLNDKYRKC